MEASVRLAIRTREGRKTLQRLAAELFPDRGKDAPLSRLWSVYEAVAKEQGYRVGETTTRMRKGACLRLLAWARGAGVKSISEIDAEEAAAFLDFVGSAGASVKTRRNVAGELASVWRVLAARGWTEAERNPWRVVKPAPQKEEQRHGRAFSEAELEAIFRACDGYPNGEEWRDMATVALYTGLRLTDVLRLEGGMADWRTETLNLTPAKTARHGISVSIPMHPKVAEVFRRRGDGLLFPRAAAGESAHKVPFKGILARAGIVAKPGEALTFHCLRHTFATRLAEAGVPEDVRMQLGGWTVRATAAIYNHDTTNARAAILGLK